MIDAFLWFRIERRKGKPVQAAHRLIGGRFSEKTQGIEHQWVGEEWAEGLKKGRMDRLLFPSLGHPRRQGELKAELSKDIRMTPNR